MARAAGTDADRPGAPRFDGAHHAADPDSRRRGVPRPGHRRRDAEPVAARRLRHRRHDPHHRQQPARVHGRRRTSRTARATRAAWPAASRSRSSHVNADDPVACLEAARLASAYRARFGRDFLIDLVGYRRYGHNEGDEPAFTQPLMYKTVAVASDRARDCARGRWSSRARSPPEAPTRWCKKHFDALEQALRVAQAGTGFVPPMPEPPPPRRGGAGRDRRAARAAARAQRRAAARARRASRCTASSNAAASGARRCSPIPTSGRSTGPPPRSWRSRRSSPTASPIRLTGEDVERGTFSHRHAVFHDANTGNAVRAAAGAAAGARGVRDPQQPAHRERDASASSSATTSRSRGRLVIWEAQYGDFINGAQVILDEFVTSGRAKWGLTPSLVLLLPHGYEGQGPEHSSARLERFLEAAADINLRLANCTTAAQYFHLLRRQAALLETRSAAAGRADAEEPAAPSGRWRRAARARPRAGSSRCIDDAEARGRASDDRARWCCAAARSTSI